MIMKKLKAALCVIAPTGRWRALFVATMTALLIGLTFSIGRAADDNNQYKVADGMGIYYGLMPAAIVRGQSASHAEGSMHGGPPARNEYHLVVALFDAATSARIQNAKVTARISSLGTSGSSRPLEPMQIAGTVSYGGYFPLPTGDRYTVHLEIERSGAARPATVDFQYDHRQH